MNPPIIQKTNRRRWWLILPLGFVAGLTLTIMLLAIGVIRSFGLSSDSAALRDGLMNSGAATDWHREIEVGVGSFALNLARTVVAFIRLEPEARTALRAFRGGDVGVYQWRKTQRRADHQALLDAADKTMTARGWDRIIGVRDRDELVAVYVPRRIGSPGKMKICVVVLNRTELVVASARGDLEPLLEIALVRLRSDQPRLAPIHL